MPDLKFEHRLIDNKAAFTYALLTHAEMYRDGITYIPYLTGQEHAVIATQRVQETDKVIGIIIWEMNDENNDAEVTLVSVHAAWRGEGVFKAMWVEACLNMAGQGAKEVCLSVVCGNHIAACAYESVGMKAAYITYAQELQAVNHIPCVK